MAKLKGRKNNRKFWQFRAAAEPGVGELLLYGEIADTTWFGDEVTPKQFWDDLQKLGDIKELKVFINSPGGDVFAGHAIHSMLKRHPATVTIYVDGVAASAASLVVMAGDRIIMPKNAMIMIHNPWTFVAGDSVFLRQVADELDKIREAMIPVYSDRTGLDRDKIIEMLDAETWMTAEEAVELGFADEIEEAKQVAASMLDPNRLEINGVTVDLSQYRHPPKLIAVPEPEKQPEEPEEKEPKNNEEKEKKLKLLELELELLTGNSLKISKEAMK